MAKVIVFTNQKKECGKSTFAINTADCLSRKNFTVLLIDADSKNIASKLIEREKLRFNIIEIKENEPVNKMVQINRNKYNYIIVDCPASADSITTYSSLLVCDLAIIPILCSGSDILNLLKIITTINDAKKINNLKEFVLINEYDKKNELTTGIIAVIKDLKMPILISKISLRESFKKSLVYGLTIFDEKDQEAIEEIEKLTREIIQISK